ncbi:unnamed protein product [Amoebophrya sp. A25]|nr:unnamed protein product [Amoebophrya sp. A25]|eukprot:GSA25T00023139001.1
MTGALAHHVAIEDRLSLQTIPPVDDAFALPTEGVPLVLLRKSVSTSALSTEETAQLETVLLSWVHDVIVHGLSNASRKVRQRMKETLPVFGLPPRLRLRDLSDGSILLVLIQALDVRLCKKGSAAAIGRIAQFQKACRRLGVPQSELLLTGDLFPAPPRNPRRVLYSLKQLHDALPPNYQGPRIVRGWSSCTTTETPWCDERQDRGEIEYTQPIDMRKDRNNLRTREPLGLQSRRRKVRIPRAAQRAVTSVHPGATSPMFPAATSRSPDEVEEMKSSATEEQEPGDDDEDSFYYYISDHEQGPCTPRLLDEQERVEQRVSAEAAGDEQPRVDADDHNKFASRGTKKQKVSVNLPATEKAYREYIQRNWQSRRCATSSSPTTSRRERLLQSLRNKNRDPLNAFRSFFVLGEPRETFQRKNDTSTCPSTGVSSSFSSRRPIVVANQRKTWVRKNEASPTKKEASPTKNDEASPAKNEACPRKTVGTNSEVPLGMVHKDKDFSCSMHSKDKDFSCNTAEAPPAEQPGSSCSTAPSDAAAEAAVATAKLDDAISGFEPQPYLTMKERKSHEEFHNLHEKGHTEKSLMSLDDFLRGVEFRRQTHASNTTDTSTRASATKSRNERLELLSMEEESNIVTAPGVNILPLKKTFRRPSPECSGQVMRSPPQQAAPEVSLALSPIAVKASAATTLVTTQGVETSRIACSTEEVQPLDLDGGFSVIREAKQTFISSGAETQTLTSAKKLPDELLPELMSKKQADVALEDLPVEELEHPVTGVDQQPARAGGGDQPARDKAHILGELHVLGAQQRPARLLSLSEPEAASILGQHNAIRRRLPHNLVLGSSTDASSAWSTDSRTQNLDALAWVRSLPTVRGWLTRKTLTSGGTYQYQWKWAAVESLRFSFWDTEEDYCVGKACVDQLNLLAIPQPENGGKKSVRVRLRGMPFGTEVENGHSKTEDDPDPNVQDAPQTAWGKATGKHKDSGKWSVSALGRSGRIELCCADDDSSSREDWAAALALQAECASALRNQILETLEQVTKENQEELFTRVVTTNSLVYHAAAASDAASTEVEDNAASASMPDDENIDGVTQMLSDVWITPQTQQDCRENASYEIEESRPPGQKKKKSNRRRKVPENVGSAHDMPETKDKKYLKTPEVGSGTSSRSSPVDATAED